MTRRPRTLLLAYVALVGALLGVWGTLQAGAREPRQAAGTSAVLVRDGATYGAEVAGAAVPTVRPVPSAGWYVSLDPARWDGPGTPVVDPDEGVETVHVDPGTSVPYLLSQPGPGPVPVWVVTRGGRVDRVLGSPTP